MTEADAWEEDWAYEQYLEHSRQAIEEFTAERLVSYYLANPRCAVAARSFVADAVALHDSQPTAALLLSATAIEVAIKDVFLRPIISGLVHSDSAAGLIAEMALRATRFDLLESPFFRLIKDYGGVDFASLRRPGQTDLLWAETKRTQKKRDQIVHRAQRASPTEAKAAIAIAEQLLDVVLPALAKTLGLHVHSSHVLCNGPFCSSTPGIELLSD
jgi:hypothetical protein